MSHISYRLATAKDIQQLVELRILMQVEVNGLSNLDVSTAYLDKVIDYFEGALDTNKYSSVIALDEEYIIAAAGVCFYEKPPSIAGGSGIVGYVTNVYTREEYRGRGVGTQLMKNLNELARKKKADKLHLGATSDGVGIYKSVGYQEPKFVNLEMKLNALADNHS
jgi:ribosomal protein S18 acetylase RimI-like enzyme